MSDYCPFCGIVLPPIRPLPSIPREVRDDGPGWSMVLIAILSFVAGCALTFVTLYAGV